MVGPDASTAVPWCVWEWDLRQRNLRFLERIDPDYFAYSVRIHTEHLKGEDSRRAAVAIRITYYHALETLFTLLCAAVQAPTCVVGWVPRCSTGQLRELVKAIGRGACVPNQLGLEDVSWRAIATSVFTSLKAKEAEREAFVQRHATLWSCLAHAFLDEKAIAEYNSLKHGFRVSSGGFSLAMGTEHQPGVPPPREEMKTLGHSEFGSSFFVPEPVEGAPESKKRDPHFRVRQYALNWIPESDAEAVQLACLSIRNLLSFLRLTNRDTQEVQFVFPEDCQDFEKPWSRSVGVCDMTMDVVVAERDILRLSAEGIRTKHGRRPPDERRT